MAVGRPRTSWERYHSLFARHDPSAENYRHNTTHHAFYIVGVTITESVGRATYLLTDHSRDQRTLPVEVWFPLSQPGGEPMMYELLPNVGFYGTAVSGGTPPSDPLPVVIVSHGHMGTRLVYSQLCEALAARGYFVVSPDHPGDTMADVLMGAGVDEVTNIELRVDDLTFVYESLIGNRDGFDHGCVIDPRRVHALGHSFGAYGIVEWSARGGTGAALASLVALQPYLLPLTSSSLQSVATPLLIVAGDKDVTTPVATNVTPALQHLPAEMTTAVVLTGVGHQGCSDVGLYIEMAPSIDGVPDFVIDFLATMSADTTGVAGEPWRPVTSAHIEIVSTWLETSGNLDATVSVAQRHGGRVITLP